MATPPTFTSGQVLTAAQMNTIGTHLIKTQTVGSAVSSVAVTNAFSADYDAYIITLSGGTMSADTNLKLQFGSTTTGYYGFLTYGSYAAATVIGANDNNAAAFSWGGGGADATAYIEVIHPYLTKPTEVRSRVRYATVYGNFIGHLANSTSYTGFTLIPAAGTMTGGTIRVYGIRNS